MIVDTCVFYNEVELLHLRLDYLYDVVDRFIIVESLDSFSKKIRKNEYIFEKNIGIYKPYMDKIRYYKIDNLPYNDAWSNEYYQKNYCAEGIGDLENDDWIIYSDVDEIPDKNLVKNLNSYHNSPSGIHFLQKLFYYHVNVMQNQIWAGSAAIQKKYLQTIMHLRRNRSNRPALQNGGWHYSYLGGIGRIYYKMVSYSHADEVEQYCNLEHIKNSIETNKDLLDRKGNMFQKYLVDITGPHMAPSNINKMLELYPYLIKNNK